MFGAPKNLDWNLLTGATLIQVCLGQHDVLFKFDPDISISVTSSIRMGGAGPASEDFGAMATQLCTLIGREITAASAAGERVVEIRFGDAVLELFDDTDHYESFVITIGSAVFVA